MTIDELIGGLNILRTYYDKGGASYALGAEHDVIDVYKTNHPLTPEDVQKMRDLGWFQPEQDNNGNVPPPYDPEAGWSVFT